MREWAWRRWAKNRALQTWNSITVMVLLGVILGAFGSYYAVVRDRNQLNDWLDSSQQKTAPAPAADAKLADGKPTKGHKGH
jgi:hypothetical protein